MLKLIKTKKDHEAALERIYELMQRNVKAGPLSDELEALSILVEAYEEKHYPVPPPHPIEAIKFGPLEIAVRFLVVVAMIQ